MIVYPRQPPDTLRSKAHSDSYSCLRSDEANRCCFLPEPKTRTRPDRINARVEAITAHSQLPSAPVLLGAGKGNRARAVVLGAPLACGDAEFGKVSLISPE